MGLGSCLSVIFISVGVKQLEEAKRVAWMRTLLINCKLGPLCQNGWQAVRAAFMPVTQSPAPVLSVWLKPSSIYASVLRTWTGPSPCYCSLVCPTGPITEPFSVICWRLKWTDDAFVYPGSISSLFWQSPQVFFQGITFPPISEHLIFRGA